jgi:hypothetical protein
MKLGWISAAACGAVLTASSAGAQTVIVEDNPRNTTVVERETTRSYRPNTGMIVSGAVLFLGTYIPSVVVAASSSNEADRNLYVPLVGPWLDLADRNGCPSGPTTCDNETTNKVLLVGNGILQAIGTIAFVSGFLFPARTERQSTVTTKPTIKFLPMQMGRGASMGGGVVGTF